MESINKCSGIALLVQKVQKPIAYWYKSTCLLVQKYLMRRAAAAALPLSRAPFEGQTSRCVPYLHRHSYDFFLFWRASEDEAATSCLIVGTEHKQIVILGTRCFLALLVQKYKY
jgi:hypothetical protein